MSKTKEVHSLIGHWPERHLSEQPKDETSERPWNLEFVSVSDLIRKYNMEVQGQGHGPNALTTKMAGNLFFQLKVICLFGVWPVGRCLRLMAAFLAPLDHVVNHTDHLQR